MSKMVGRTLNKNFQHQLVTLLHQLVTLLEAHTTALAASGRVPAGLTAALAVSPEAGCALQ